MKQVAPRHTMYKITQKIRSRPQHIPGVYVGHRSECGGINGGCRYVWNNGEIYIGTCAGCWGDVRANLKMHFTTADFVGLSVWRGGYMCPVCLDRPRNWDCLWFIGLCDECNETASDIRGEFPTKMLLVRTLLIPELAAAIIRLM
jgi:hypothetical protein